MFDEPFQNVVVSFVSDWLEIHMFANILERLEFIEHNPKPSTTITYRHLLANLPTITNNSYSSRIWSTEYEYSLFKYEFQEYLLKF